MPNVANLKENPDIYYYNQNEKLITKDEIKELLNNLSKTSQFNNKKIYIINGAEKMSDTVYNAILKTLEEPKDNIYAFLVTKNIDQINDTIKSRCQIIFLNSALEKKVYDDKIIEVANNLIENIENYGVDTIVYYNKIYTEIVDRDNLKQVLNVLFDNYYNSLKKLLNDEKSNSIIIKNNDIISLSKKILVVDKYINLLNSYLNKNLILDRFIIEMWRCKNEMC